MLVALVENSVAINTFNQFFFSFILSVCRVPFIVLVHGNNKIQNVFVWGHMSYAMNSIV